MRIEFDFYCGYLSPGIIITWRRYVRFILFGLSTAADDRWPVFFQTWKDPLDEA